MLHKKFSTWSSKSSYQDDSESLLKDVAMQRKLKSVFIPLVDPIFVYF